MIEGMVIAVLAVWAWTWDHGADLPVEARRMWAATFEGLLDRWMRSDWEIRWGPR